MSARKLKIITLALGSGAILVDQLIKSIFLWKIPANGIFLVSTNFFSIKLEIARNPFIAFSIPLATIVIYILTLLLLFGLFYFLKQSLHKNIPVVTISLALIVGAAISNFIDRLVHGAVIDYLDITIYSYHWATFNLADTIITICALIIILENFRKKI